MIALVAMAVTLNAQTNNGYEKSIETGAAIGIGEHRNNTYSVSMINGYRFNNYLFVGIGVGVGYTNAVGLVKSDDLNIGATSYKITRKIRTEQLPIPIYLNAKLNVLRANNFSPFIRLDLGYTIDAFQYLKDAPGLMIEPSCGVEFIISEKASMYSLVGFNLQNQKIDMLKNIGQIDSWEIGSKNMMLKAISVRVGVSF